MLTLMVVGTTFRFLNRRLNKKMDELIVQREMLSRASGNGHLYSVPPFEYQKTG